MGYHLPRVMHWIQNKNLNHYITSDARQLFYQPFAEHFILHIKLLSASDLWVNLVQFFAMVGSVVIVTLLARMFGLNYRYQLLSALLALSIPMGILQSTTTQNDYVATFFFLAFLFFGLRAIKKNGTTVFSDVFFSSIALGLGFLTKATCAIFAFPFALYFAYVFLRDYGFKAWKFGVIYVFSILIFNFSFWARNYSLTGNILGEKAVVNMTENDYITIPFFVSNVVRNIATHLALPLGNRLMNKSVIVFHEKVLKISPQEKAITFCAPQYEPFFAINEDVAGNFFFLFLLFFLITYFLFNF
ncbi:MAG: glycosyltransferase family 39 protein, partial [Parachlamydiales bacterium]|nr:glycosyltransferase family 39 protein [Parachlamydiales bacterium]